MLDHFVGGVEGAAADDVGRAVAFDADGVFADVFEPEVFEGAGAWDGGSVLIVISLLGVDGRMVVSWKRFLLHISEWNVLEVC